MIDIYTGTSHNDIPTGLLTKRETENFQSFCESYLVECQPGKKNDYYLVIGDTYSTTTADPEASPQSYKSQDHYHRNNVSQISAWLLPFDGDSSISEKGNCIPPIEVHEALTQLGYNHVVYTTHSHVKDEKNRWRCLIPCRMVDKNQLQPNVDQLYEQLTQAGCSDLAMSSESKTWSIPWFLPSRDDPKDGQYEYYAFFEGRDFLSVNVEVSYSTEETISTGTSKTVSDMLAIIREGKADTGLHESTRDIANGLVKDGVQPGAAKAILHHITENYDLNDTRQKENKNKIDALVDSAYVKVKVGTAESTEDAPEWQEQDKVFSRTFTDYPDQGGMMEHVVQTCMDFMIYPNKQIAVTAAHALISTLGGRIYSFEGGNGVVLTSLITGRSTIGKSFVKKFCIFALNNFQLAATSQYFIGSQFYTSAKNLVDELREAGSLLSVRTESGQSDRSSAGDMTRVLMYELELATESGMRGYISSGGQNERIPQLFSPAVTTIRESVAQIQNEADVLNASSISGTAGRRSHVLIDPIKAEPNENPITELSKEFKKLMVSLFKKAGDERRKNIDEPLPHDLWVVPQFKDPLRLRERAKDWLIDENKNAMEESHFNSTFYGRLGERIPAYAARLAIADSPDEPVITNEHIEIAEKSLVAEFTAHKGQRDSGELDPKWTKLVGLIKDLFRGDMSQNTTLALSGDRLVRDGAADWTRIRDLIKHREEYKELSAKDGFPRFLKDHLQAENIVKLTKKEALDLYGKRSEIFKRVS